MSWAIRLVECKSPSAMGGRSGDLHWRRGQARSARAFRLCDTVGEAFGVGFELRDLLAQRLILLVQLCLSLVLNHQNCRRANNDKGGEAEFEFGRSHKFEKGISFQGA